MSFNWGLLWDWHNFKASRDWTNWSIRGEFILMRTGCFPWSDHVQTHSSLTCFRPLAGRSDLGALSLVSLSSPWNPFPRSPADLGRSIDADSVLPKVRLKQQFFFFFWNYFLNLSFSEKNKITLCPIRSHGFLLYYKLYGPSSTGTSPSLSFLSVWWDCRYTQC